MGSLWGLAMVPPPRRPRATTRIDGNGRAGNSTIAAGPNHPTHHRPNHLRLRWDDDLPDEPARESGRARGEEKTMHDAT